jgi:hypothetical protein
MSGSTLKVAMVLFARERMMSMALLGIQITSVVRSKAGS